MKTPNAQDLPDPKSIKWIKDDPLYLRQPKDIRLKQIIDPDNSKK